MQIKLFLFLKLFISFPARIPPLGPLRSDPFTEIHPLVSSSSYPSSLFLPLGSLCSNAFARISPHRSLHTDPSTQIPPLRSFC